ncbi:hypothetical protein V8C44DRAFT_20149 [Trichoderma aethiopicum]
MGLQPVLASFSLSSFHSTPEKGSLVFISVLKSHDPFGSYADMRHGSHMTLPFCYLTSNNNFPFPPKIFGSPTCSSVFFCFLGLDLFFFLGTSTAGSGGNGWASNGTKSLLHHFFFGYFRLGIFFHPFFFGGAGNYWFTSDVELGLNRAETNRQGSVSRQMGVGLGGGEKAVLSFCWT